MCSFKIRLRFVVIGQLNVENAARQIEGRRIGLQAYPFIDHINADLKGFVRKRDVGEIQIKTDIPWVTQNGLPKRADRLRCVASVFIGS